MKEIFEQFFCESIDTQVLLDLELNKFLMCNEKVFDMYGYTQKEFLKITPYDLSVEFKDNIQMENKQENIFNQSFDKFITKHKRKDGTLINVYVKSRKINYKDKYWLLIVLVDLEKEEILKKYFNKNFEDKDILIIQKEFKWYKKTNTLLKNNIEIELTNKEKKILNLLISNINNTVSYELIYSLFENQKITNNSLLSSIKRIRKKCSSSFIKTIYSQGYAIYIN